MYVLQRKEELGVRGCMKNNSTRFSLQLSPESECEDEKDIKNLEK